MFFLEVVGKAEIDYYQGEKFNPATLRDADDEKRER